MTKGAGRSGWPYNRMQGDAQRAKTRTTDFPFAGRAELQRMRGLRDLCDVLAKKRCTPLEDWQEAEWVVIPDAPSPFQAKIPPPWQPPTTVQPNVPFPPKPPSDPQPPPDPKLSPDSSCDPKIPTDPSLQPKVEISSDRTVRYRCCISTCNKLYSSKYRCSMHIIARHTGDTDRPFICRIPGCTKAYATKDSLTRHRRITGHVVPEEPTDKKEPTEKKPTLAKEPEGKYAQSGDFQNRVQELVDLFDEF